MPPVVLVLLAAVLFGTTGTAQALGAPGAGALSLGSARIVVGGGALGLLALVLARRRRTPLVPPKGEQRNSVAPSVLVGAAGVVVYQPAFFTGTVRNGVAVGTLVALGSAPLLTGALSWVLERRFPGARWCVATSVALVGLALLAGAASPPDAAGTDPPGLLASLLAGASYAVYAVMSKRLLDAGWSGASAMGGIFGVAAAVGLVLLATTSTAWLATPPGLATVLWLGLATVAVAYLLFAAGLRRLSAASASTLTLAEPLTAALLGLVVLREQLSLPSWLGLGGLAAGILILALAPRRAALLRRAAPS